MDPRLRVAVDASLRWYDDVFALHGIPTSFSQGLWWSSAPPPRWHSAALVLDPGVPVERVVRAVEAFGSCAVADAYSAVDLSSAGFSVLFEATWIHLPPADAATTAAPPAAWSVLQDAPELAIWNERNDTADVLLPAVLGHPRLAVLAQREDAGLVRGAVLHDAGPATGLSNQWTADGVAPDVEAIVACARALHPRRAVVGYERDEDLGPYLAAGFARVGRHRVWAR